MEQNDILHNEIDNLEGEIGRLKVFEDKLTAIAEIQGMQVDHLVSLVDENGKVLKEMKVSQFIYYFKKSFYVRFLLSQVVYTNMNLIFFLRHCSKL
mmetsp:Transcript_59789/g.88708  ORF Transcript_59789/g.88708 Transcript_59789/m.88708 type:complete len:96 (-) Transcript_59789:901-1188(-)